MHRTSEDQPMFDCLLVFLLAPLLNDAELGKKSVFCVFFTMGSTGFSYFGAISFSECLPQQAPPGDPVGGEQEGQNPAALLIRMVLMNCQWDQEHVSEAETSATESVSWCFMPS